MANNHHSYALFKAKDKKLLDDDDYSSRLQTADLINSEYVSSPPTRKFQCLLLHNSSNTVHTGSSSRRS